MVIHGSEWADSRHDMRGAGVLGFVPAPQTSNKFPAEYLQRVKQTHMHGGYGSIGYNYDWKLAEAQKNLMRTHTTAVSSRMLFKLAQVRTSGPVSRS